MNANVVKEKLKKGKTVYGIFHAFDSPEIIEMLGNAGYDFVVLDGEHGNITPSSCENLIRAAECTGIVPIMRIPGHERQNILKSLDRRAMGILVPMVNNKQHAMQIVEYAKYEPMGSRGLSYSNRAGQYGGIEDKDSYRKFANEQTIVILQIETKEAIENLDEILAVENFDIAFIGPSDLSQSYGMTGQVNNEKFQGIIRGAVKKIIEKGKVAGILVGNMESAKMWKEEGVQFISFASPAILQPAIKAHSKACKAL